MKPDSVELGWTDHDGDRGHIIVGDLANYAGPVQPDTIAIIETRSKGEREWTAVYLPRDIAESLHDALGRSIADGQESGAEVPPSSILCPACGAMMYEARLLKGYPKTGEGSRRLTCALHGPLGHFHHIATDRKRDGG